ncbi:MAG: UDP-N-acetylmuramate dehydrogenase [Oscillospiraceae bacterium]|nr:UDP-N-acetylmuramate dehydrogenase [Oscillospiraceae bacterium]
MRTVLEILAMAFPGLEIRPGEPMRSHCSFRIGGPCVGLVLPRTLEEMGGVLRALQDMNDEPLLLGNGTNLLITDEPLDRIVVGTERMTQIERDEDDGLFALAGVPLSRLAAQAAEFGLTGLEFAHGIPGTLGGAVVMNAGAYGGEMKDVVDMTMFMDEQGEVDSLSGGEHAFGYRQSAFSSGGKAVLGCRIQLREGEPDTIRSTMEDLMERRRTSQPLDRPSAGSTFKRPKEGYAAALIDQAGLKGYRVGDAAVSEKHAGFVVNLGQARFDDVIAVMEHVQSEVLRQFGVELEPEVRIVR